MSYFTHLECGYCREQYSHHEIQTVCNKCGKPLLARYNLARASQELSQKSLPQEDNTLWRFRQLLPVLDRSNEISLGEGITPLLPAKHLAKELGLKRLFIKDESLNPTGSFKARGLCMAISKAKELGIEKVVIPSAGNAAGAMSAYAAAASMQAQVFMPEDVPAPFVQECRAYGAQVNLIDGLITDCGQAAAHLSENGWFNVSTLNEPYRLEGKKTMGYELAKSFDWKLPDVIIYPTGGGTGLIGMWKAFAELRELGWIDGNLPRMVSVQAEGCAPIPRALEQGKEFAALWEDARTAAAGIRVPSAIGDFLILQAIRESNGTAISVTEESLLTAQCKLSQTEGIFACPESGATLACLQELLCQGWVSPDERIVLFNTGTGLKYPTAN